MKSWEARMSAKAKSRQAVAEAEEIVRREADLVRMRADLDAALPALPGEDDVIIATDHFWREHHGHRPHYHQGIATICSCGVVLGMGTIAIDPDAPPELPPCSICEARGIARR